MIFNFFENERNFKQNENIRIKKINDKLNFKNKKENLIDISKPLCKPENKIATNKEDEKTDRNAIKINKEIKHIFNIFSCKYSNAVKPTGLGDYIRGCYFLMQFCEKSNIKLDFFIIEHPLMFYLEYFNSKTLELDGNEKINKLDFSNIRTEINSNNYIISHVNDGTNADFIDFMNLCHPSPSGKVYVNINCLPTFPIKNIHITLMKNILNPCEEILCDVKKKLSNLGIKKNEYCVIHVRMGDDFLTDKKTQINYKILNKLIGYISCLPKNTYMLITDCNILKQYIISNYSFLNLKFICNNISHTISTNNEDIKNTLVDFYIMSFSSGITAYSVYEHGSGFSQWCATTYNIPYSCRLLRQ